MNAKTLMTVIGTITLIEGFGFYFGAEAVTSGGFPELSGNALQVGAIMHEALASIMIGMGCLILFLRNNTGEAAKNSLMGIALANLVFLIGGSIHLVNSPAKPPLPALGLMLVIAIACFVSAKKVETE